MVSLAAYASIPGESGRVDQSARWKRLSSRHLEVFLEQGGEAHARLVQELGGDPGIEEVAGPETILAIEEAEVVVGIVEYDLDRGIGEHDRPAEQARRPRVDPRWPSRFAKKPGRDRRGRGTGESLPPRYRRRATAPDEGE